MKNKNENIFVSLIEEFYFILVDGYYISEISFMIFCITLYVNFTKVRFFSVLNLNYGNVCTYVL